MSIELDQEQLASVRRILREHVPDCVVWAFGSRVRGGAKRFSDLDLAVFPETSLSVRRLALLAEAFAESDLPIRVDVVDWTSLGEDARRSITQCHEVVLE